MTTTVTKTIGTSSRQYSTLNGFLAALPASLVSSDEQWVGEGYNDSEFSEDISVPSVTTDATRNIILRPASGEGYNDHANVETNPRRYDQTKGLGVRITGNYHVLLTIPSSIYITVSGIQFHYDTTYGSSYYRTINGISVNALIEKCLIQDRRSAATSVRSAGDFVNNWVILSNASSFSGTAVASGNSVGSGDAVVICNTIVRPSDLSGGGTGLNIDFAVSYPLARNNAVFGFTTAFGGTIASYASGSGYNASDASSSNIPGSNNVDSLTFSSQFEVTTDASKDFRAASGGSLGGAGTRDQTYTNDLDGANRARSTTTPTIGAWEVVVSAVAVMRRTLSSLGARVGSRHV